MKKSIPHKDEQVKFVDEERPRTIDRSRPNQEAKLTKARDKAKGVTGAPRATKE